MRRRGHRSALPISGSLAAAWVPHVFGGHFHREGSYFLLYALRILPLREDTLFNCRQQTLLCRAHQVPTRDIVRISSKTSFTPVWGERRARVIVSGGT